MVNDDDITTYNPIARPSDLTKLSRSNKFPHRPETHQSETNALNERADTLIFQNDAPWDLAQLSTFPTRLRTKTYAYDAAAGSGSTIYVADGGVNIESRVSALTSEIVGFYTDISGLYTHARSCTLVIRTIITER